MRAYHVPSGGALFLKLFIQTSQSSTRAIYQYFYYITMIFIVFSAKPFLRNKIDPIPLISKPPQLPYNWFFSAGAIFCDLSPK
jgi:hypothetical protein